MNRTYDAGQKAAHSLLEDIISDTDKKMADIYRKAYRDMVKTAKQQKPGGLTERWQSDMAAALKEREKELRGEVRTVLQVSMMDAARLTANANADWLDIILQRAGVSLGGDSFRSVLTRTADDALRQIINGTAYLDSRSLSRRIWRNSAKARQGINEVLQQGIAQKKSAYDLAKDLEQFVNPKAWKDYDWAKIYPDMPVWLQPRSVEFHAQTLARTTINHAYHFAMKETAAKNPFVDCIHWALSPDHYERQVRAFGADICDDYAYHDEGLGLGNWPIKSLPMPHPRCLCHQYAVVEKALSDCADELKRWLDGEPNAKLEKAFGEWKGEWSGKKADQQQGTASPRTVSVKKPQDGRTKAMEQIASQPWTQRLRAADREAVFNVLNNATDWELAFFAKNGTMIQGSFYRNHGGYYSPATKSVYMNIAQNDPRSAAMGFPTSDVRLFFHETGHLFDYQAFSGTRLLDELGSAFEEQLKQDFIAHANSVLAKAKEPLINDLSRLTSMQKAVLSQDLFQSTHAQNAVSDLAEGITGARVKGAYGHGKTYWATMSPGTEAVAHMYEAMMTKGDRLKAIKEYYPDSYAMYTEALKRLFGGGTP